MEKAILKELDYRLLKPYPIHFLRRFSRLSHTDTNVHYLAKYFIDLSLLESSGSVLLPSKKAAAAFILANSILHGCPPHGVWTGKLVLHTGYSLQEISATLKTLLVAVREKHVLCGAKAIRNKYIKKAPTEEMKSLLVGSDLLLDKVEL